MNTRFRSLPPLPASLILAGTVALMAYGLWATSPPTTGPGVAGPFGATEARSGADADLYRAVVRRVRAGEWYYVAAAAELRGRGYATRPFFNWRPPFLAGFLGSLPSLDHGVWVLRGLALLTLLAWVRVLARHHGAPGTLAGGALLLGPLLLCVGEESVVFHEMWAGLLVALSLALYSPRRWVVSAAVGLLALFVRELALPYVGMMSLAAWWKQRHWEALFWLAGICLFIGFLVLHAAVVSSLLSGADLANKSWVDFGGWAFVLSTAQWNAFLLLFPAAFAWVLPVGVPLALLGIAGWMGRIGTRAALTVGAYVVALLVAGRPDNFYWGLLYAPLLPLGLLYVYPSIADLLRAAMSQRREPLQRGPFPTFSEK